MKIKLLFPLFFFVMISATFSNSVSALNPYSSVFKKDFYFKVPVTLKDISRVVLTVKVICDIRHKNNSRVYGEGVIKLTNGAANTTLPIWINAAAGKNPADYELWTCRLSFIHQVSGTTTPYPANTPACSNVVNEWKCAKPGTPFNSGAVGKFRPASAFRKDKAKSGIRISTRRMVMTGHGSFSSMEDNVVATCQNHSNRDSSHIEVRAKWNLYPGAKDYDENEALRLIQSRIDGLLEVFYTRRADGYGEREPMVRRVFHFSLGGRRRNVEYFVLDWPRSGISIQCLYRVTLTVTRVGDIDWSDELLIKLGRKRSAKVSMWKRGRHFLKKVTFLVGVDQTAQGVGTPTWITAPVTKR